MDSSAKATPIQLQPGNIIMDQAEQTTAKKGGAVNPNDVFGDTARIKKEKEANISHGVENVPNEKARELNADSKAKAEVTQDTPPEKGENLDEDAVNAPRDPGSAFNVRTSPRVLPTKN